MPIPESYPIFVRRIGPDPRSHTAHCVALEKCPDLWELGDGNFAVIGIDMTAEAGERLPPGAGCGPDERVVLVPRSLLVGARPNIPST